MRKMKAVPICCLVLATLGSLIWYGLRERWSQASDIDLEDGSSLHVLQYGSEWRYFGGHGVGFGGGGPSQTVQFSRFGKRHSWSGPYTPILLQFDGTVPVLVVFDRETDFSRICFRYYRYDGNWKETVLSTFPKKLALQNLWLSHNNGMRDGKVIDQYEVVRLLDAESPDFQDSLTAKLWLCVANDKQWWQVAETNVEASFLHDYKRSYITR